MMQVTTATQLSDLEAKDRTHREALATARRDSADKIAGTSPLAHSTPDRPSFDRNNLCCAALCRPACVQSWSAACCR